MTMQYNKHLTDLELAKAVLLGIAAVASACAGIWLLGFAVGLIR
jgi:hypothetical protein